MAELRGAVRERLRRQLSSDGATGDLTEPEIFDAVEALLQRAVHTTDQSTLLLPELLGDPRSWRLGTAMHYQSHREGGAGSVILFLKRRVLMPVMRWLFEYSRDNFERQRRVNTVLFACIQELAVENARLRRDLQQLSGQAPGAAARNAASPDAP